MPAFDIVQLGASALDADSKLPGVQAVNPVTEDPADIEDFGKVDLFCGLGLTALPAPKSATGVAEGVLLRSCGGTEGCIVGARDERTADVLGELAPGDTALHATGQDFDSRVLCKDQQVAIVAGDGSVISLEGVGEKCVIAVGGNVVEVSKENGISLADAGGAAIIMKDGNISIVAKGLTIDGKVFLGSSNQAEVDDVALGLPTDANFTAISSALNGLGAPVTMTPTAAANTKAK